MNFIFHVNSKFKPLKIVVLKFDVLNPILHTYSHFYQNLYVYLHIILKKILPLCLHLLTIDNIIYN